MIYLSSESFYLSVPLRTYSTLTKYTNRFSAHEPFGHEPFLITLYESKSDLLDLLTPKPRMTIIFSNTIPLDSDDQIRRLQAVTEPPAQIIPSYHILPEEQKYQLRKLAEAGEDIFPLFRNGITSLWSLYNFGLTNEQSGNRFRGYLQVNPAQLLEAAPIALELARELSANGRAYKIKFLVAKLPTVIYAEASSIAAIGFYENHSPTDPIMVVYADNKDDVLFFLAKLSLDPRWGKIERERPEKARRAGSNAFSDPSGKEWRTLGYNDHAGFAEDLLRAAQSDGEDWRGMVLGMPTEFIPNTLPDPD